MSASDRFQLVPQPAFSPAGDLITGSTVGPFVDCGAWVQPSPRKQRIYLSVETIRALAEAAGVIQPVIDDVAIARYRAEGALDFLKENLHGDLSRALVRVAALLDDADVADVEGVGEGADDSR